MKDVNLVQAEKAKKWAVALLRKCNMDAEGADIVADILVSANLRGVDTHGLVMIRHYVRRFTTIPMQPVRVILEDDSTCLVDGGANYGMLAAHFAMSRAIEKAKTHGAGVASVRNSNHSGAMAYYALMAADKGCVGISITGGGARMSPWGGTKAFLGNNPIGIALPGDEFPLVLDMALSVVAYQKLVTSAREGLPLPEGWAFDKNGEPTTDPQAGLDGLLAPIGGYKGAGLSVMTDLLCGALSQGIHADTIRSVDEYDKPRGNGHFFIAINVESFLPLPIFKSLVKAYSDRFHAVPARPGAELFIPGELEYRTYKDRIVNGFPLTRPAAEQLNEVAGEFNVEPLVD